MVAEVSALVGEPIDAMSIEALHDHNRSHLEPMLKRAVPYLTERKGLKGSEASTAISSLRARIKETSAAAAAAETAKAKAEAEAKAKAEAEARAKAEEDKKKYEEMRREVARKEQTISELRKQLTVLREDSHSAKQELYSQLYQTFFAFGTKI